MSYKFSNALFIGYSLCRNLAGVGFGLMPELRVMTLNVRQPDQNDGVNCWEYRRRLLAYMIIEAAPDLIGMQELFCLQAEYILARAQQYQWFGAGRFGDSSDKHVGVFYRTDRLHLLDHCDFWLSRTPDIPGSSSWEIIRPRQVTWGCFETSNGQRFDHFNTHFPYRGVEQEARAKTADLLKARTRSLNPVLVTADFNSPAGGEIHQALAEDFQDA